MKVIYLQESMTINGRYSLRGRKSDSLVAKINEGISDMTRFVLFWSGACLQSNWVERELNAAVKRLIEHKTPIIIVRLDETPVPALIADLFRIEADRLEPSEIARTLVTKVKRLAQRNPKKNVA